jgi:DUF4097 and DUF4098 domain-containing protein YvlB
MTAVQQTDTIIDLDGAVRLELENSGGQVIVTTWDRDAVRIQAEHSSRTFIEVDHRGGVLQIEADAQRGPTTIVDYELTVPASLDLEIDGMFTDVTVEGMNGDIEVETLEGNIRIVGGSGTVTAESTNGEITIEGAEGTIEATAVSRSIEIINSSGEILAESVGGSIIMRGITADVVEAGTIGGRIHYSGTIQDRGRYFFGSHGGRITLEFPSNVNATVMAVSLTGSIRANYPGAPTEFSRRERESFTLGTGSAQVEAETFSGAIIIERQGSGNEADFDDDLGHLGDGAHAEPLDHLAGAAVSDAITLAVDVALDVAAEVTSDMGESRRRRDP